MCCGVPGKLFEIKQADELLDAEFIAKWEDRRAIDSMARTVLTTILQRFIDRGGPVRVDDLRPLVPEQDVRAISEALVRLDEKDLILLHEGQVMVAYPLSGVPTAFRVMLPGGQERYAVCAIDALGVPPMLGRPVSVRSVCHHCGEPLDIHVRPDGPVERSEIMVWVGERADIREKACSTICPTINFFGSENHLVEWRAAHPDLPGAAAVLDEAFKVGARIFGQLLREIVPDPTPRRPRGSRGRPP